MINQYTRTYWFKIPMRDLSVEALAMNFLKACNNTKGITILGSLGPRVFPSIYKHAFMLIVELAESHASMCTYPENGVFAAQISTCGDFESLESFRSSIESIFNTSFITEGDSCESLYV
jgi:S-adenosylmethionine/arginine decarboxylase-like enzyme